jgi:hypothetical protein
VQVDLSFKLAGGKQGLIWASMNDTADRVTAYAKQDVDSADTSPVDLAPAVVIRFNTIRFDGQAIYRGARVYGFHVDEQNDEIALGFEKRDFIDADGHASLRSVVIVNRGGADFRAPAMRSAASPPPQPIAGAALSRPAGPGFAAFEPRPVLRYFRLSVVSCRVSTLLACTASAQA